MKRLGIKTSRVFWMKSGFSDLPVNRRNFALRSKDHAGIVKESAMSHDCLSWTLVYKPAYEAGRKILEKNRLNALRMFPKPCLP